MAKPPRGSTKRGEMCSYDPKTGLYTDRWLWEEIPVEWRPSVFDHLAGNENVKKRLAGLFCYVDAWPIPARQLLVTRLPIMVGSVHPQNGSPIAVLEHDAPPNRHPCALLYRGISRGDARRGH
jgi:hypothetical protein